MNSTRLTITAALLILTILAAGCISTDPVQEKTAAQGNQIDAKETPPKVDAPVEEAEPAPVETHWWDSKAGYEAGSYPTLFGDDIYGVRNLNSAVDPNNPDYNLFDIDTRAHIFNHLEYTPSMLNLERELQPAQYRQLVEEYGRPSLIIMETIDTDGGGMDKVAVRYEGGKGTKTVIMNYSEGSDAISSYVMGVVYLD